MNLVFPKKTSAAPTFVCAVISIWPAPARAHLVTTGMGPVYDGIGHLILTPEDLIPAFAVALFTGLHGAHLVSGLIFLLITLGSAIRLNVHSKKLLQIEMCMTYWHFLGGLWLYLYIFLLINL